MQDWETLIAQRMRPCVALKIEDASKRNAANATKRWRKKNWDHYLSKQKEWAKANPEKMHEYRMHNKDNVKRWAEEHQDQVRESHRKSEAKRRTDPVARAKRQAWQYEYNRRPDVMARRREQGRKRQQTPKRKEYERQRSHRRWLAKVNSRIPSVLTFTLQDIGLVTVHIYKEFA